MKYGCLHCAKTWDDGNNSFFPFKENVYASRICEECVKGNEPPKNIVWKIKVDNREIEKEY